MDWIDRLDDIAALINQNYPDVVTIDSTSSKTTSAKKGFSRDKLAKAKASPMPKKNSNGEVVQRDSKSGSSPSAKEKKKATATANESVETVSPPAKKRKTAKSMKKNGEAVQRDSKSGSPPSAKEKKKPKATATVTSTTAVSPPTPMQPKKATKDHKGLEPSSESSQLVTGRLRPRNQI